MTSENVINLIGTLVWPVVVLLLVIAFRSQLKNILARLEMAKLPGGAEISLRQLKPDNALTEEEAAALPDPESINWGTASLFWLAFNLIASGALIAYTDDPDEILDWTAEVRYYALAMNLGDEIVARLDELVSIADLFERDSDGWTRKIRIGYREKIGDVIQLVAKLAEDNEPSFEKYKG